MPCEKVVSAPAGREQVRYMIGKGLSERRSLAVVPMSAAALRYQPPLYRDVDLRARIVALAQRHKRYGVGIIHKLHQEDHLINHKRVERLYREERLQVRRCKRKKVPLG
jgi:putative transposase